MWYTTGVGGYHTIGDGILSIHSGTVNGGGGNVLSRQLFTAGAATKVLECRASLTEATSGVCGFWGDNHEGYLFFGAEEGHLEATIWPSTSSPAYRSIIIPDVDGREWHVYRIEVNRIAARFFIDGVLKVTVSDNLPTDKPMCIRLGMGSNGQDQVEYLDYVRLSEINDTSPPIITQAITGITGDNGWYKSDVSVSWNVTDPESGIASSTGCNLTTISMDTPGA